MISIDAYLFILCLEDDYLFAILCDKICRFALA